MKYFMLLVGALASMLMVPACVVSETTSGPGGTCEAISCQDALVSGLASGDDAICDATVDSMYQDLLDCACADSSPCAGACGDNLCSYYPETSDCGDCLDMECGAEHDTCANN